MKGMLVAVCAATFAWTGCAHGSGPDQGLRRDGQTVADTISYPVGDTEDDLFPTPEGRTAWRLPFVDRAVRAYRGRFGRLPESLSVLVDATLHGRSELLFDGWGRPFVYVVTGSRYRLTSSGPDGEPGTADDIDAADIVW